MKSLSIDTQLPVVAVVGRPNVGKSSLVNRILGRREAIVEETPGVTRDRRSFHAEWAGRTFELVDTGGLEPGAKGLDARVAEQARVAIEAADAIVLVVDAAGPQQDDLEVADLLRGTAKPVVLVVNKIDSEEREPDAAAFHRLGLGDPVPVSALHGRGSGDFLERLVRVLPEEHVHPSSDWASIAVVGRPNVGKSSLVNALLGEERAIVHPSPGTTRDPTDSFLRLDDERVLRLVDTAGLRRRTHIDDPIEYFSYLRTRGTLNRVDAVVLLIDASEGVTGLDQRLAEDVVEAGRACVIGLNKWDLVNDPDERERVERTTRRKLRFATWAPTLRVSALTKRGVGKLLPAVEAAVESHRRRLPTATVNVVVRDAQERRPHPRTGGRARRIRYAVQADVGPPLFLLFGSRALQPDYMRYLEHAIRAVEPFEGSPLRIEARSNSRR